MPKDSQGAGFDATYIRPLAYVHGYHDQLNGKRDNPYSTDADRQDWWDGYVHAQVQSVMHRYAHTLMMLSL